MGVKDGICRVLGKDMGHVLVEQPGLPPVPRLLSSVKQVIIMMPHQNGLAEALFPISVVIPHLHLLGNALPNICDSIPYLRLVLNILLTPDGNDILYFPTAPVLCPGLVAGGRWARFIHCPQWCPLESQCLWVNDGLAAREWVEGWMEAVADTQR